MKQDDNLTDITTKIPMLLTYQADGDMITKNVPIFEFKDIVLDYGAYFGYLGHLPKEERERKVKALEKIYPELKLD